MTGLIINKMKDIINAENKLAELLGQKVIDQKYVEWISEDSQKHEDLFESLSALDNITLASMAPRIEKALPNILGSYPPELNERISEILIKAVHAALIF